MKRAMLPLSLMLLASPALADSKVGQISINPFAGYTVPDSKRELNDAPTYGISGEYRTSPNWATSLFYHETGTEPEGVPGYSDSAYDFKKYGLNVLYYFMPEAKLQPYAVLGAANAEHEADNETNLNLGAGIRYYFTNNFSVNGEVIGSHSTDDDLDDGLASIGVAYAFGGKKEEAKAAPAAAVVAAPTDSDGDGVLDPSDQCPGTPAGVPVDAVGCPLDSDKDGVTDNLDQCPGTPAGTAVDETGCRFKKESAELKIQFPTNSATIAEQYQPEIKKLADFLVKYPAVAINIEGHTDAQGSNEFNKKLSQQRAESVKGQLVTRYGISANRINPIGYGEEKPLASNDTANGRQQNRRVVAVISSSYKE
ncbi:MAG TPA: OmpA family protein [Dongiaceae bacterium]|nr:OmpA family protein [Dongiaceae bacterium]